VRPRPPRARARRRAGAVVASIADADTSYYSISDCSVPALDLTLAPPPSASPFDHQA